MADKSPKFIDIKSPDKATPSSTSRPIVVANRSVLGGDPMVNAADGSGEAKPAEPVTRSAKTIKPVSADLVAPEKSDDYVMVPEQPSATVEATEPAAEPEKSDPEAAPAAPEPAKVPEPSDKPEEEADEDEAAPTKRDVAAEAHADEAKTIAISEAEAARQEELEQLIASRKYVAPVNAAHRKRSRNLAVILMLIVVVLAVAVFDAALDAGYVNVDGIPHTNLLKDK